MSELYPPVPPHVTASLKEWVDRCALRKCSEDSQATLLSTFAPMIRKSLKRFPAAAADRLSDELFKPDIVGPPDREKDRSKDNLVAFCDRVFYDSYIQTTDPLTRALKAHLLGLETRIALKELSKYRFHQLVEKTLIKEQSLATTPDLEQKGAASLEKKVFYPVSVDDPNFSAPSPDELFNASLGYDQLADVAICMNDARFNDLGQRLLWLRNHSQLIRSAEAPGFVGFSKSQIYDRCNATTASLVEWMECHLPGAPTSAQIEFIRRLLAAIEHRLVTNNLIPAPWLEAIAPCPEQT